jgi:hypothetical protein
VTYAEECELKGRLLQPRPKKEKAIRKTTSHFRLSGKLAGTVSIDGHGTISFRPLRRRKVYISKLDDVIGLMVQRLAMAEAAAKRAARKHR